MSEAIDWPYTEELVLSPPPDILPERPMHLTIVPDILPEASENELSSAKSSDIAYMRMLLADSARTIISYRTEDRDSQGRPKRISQPYLF